VLNRKKKEQITIATGKLKEEITTLQMLRQEEKRLRQLIEAEERRQEAEEAKECGVKAKDPRVEQAMDQNWYVYV
jgi:translation initiation factor IF-2